MIELSPSQQITQTIADSQRILLLTHENPDGDALGSILALSQVLKKLEKEISAACVDEVPSLYQFLPAREILAKELTGSRDFIISLDCTKTQAEKLGYKLEGNKLNIFITPKLGNFQASDVSFSYGGFKSDLIVVLDTPDLERLGALYDKNSQIFYEAPVINIDHHPTNNHFGKINLVDLTATSTSEILISIIESLEKEKKLMDEDIATCLLCGIISDTGSFQNTNTTPKSFTISAQLLAAGARHEELVQHLFKTKSLTTLKLWGRILSKIVYQREARFAYSLCQREDLKESGATEEELSGLIDELLKTVSHSDLVFLLSERKEGIHGSFRSIDKNVNCQEIVRDFGGGGHQGAAAFLIKEKEMKEVLEKVLEKVREYQKKRLG